MLTVVKCKLLFCFILLNLFISSGAVVYAEAQCKGRLYKVKRDKAPVFSEADLTSAVIVSLEQGDRVCYVGEKDKFIIIDGHSLPASAKLRALKAGIDESALGGLLYVRRVETRSVQTTASDQPGWASIYDKFGSYVDAWRNGVVPDNGLVPYEPFIDWFRMRVPEGGSLTSGEGRLPVDSGNWGNPKEPVDKEPRSDQGATTKQGK